MASEGSQDRRWGLKGEGLRLPGEGSERSGRGQRGRGEAIGEVEAPRTWKECLRGKKVGGRRRARPWRSDGGGGRRAVKPGAVRTWEACSLGRLRLGRGMDPKEVGVAVSLESTKRYVDVECEEWDFGILDGNWKPLEWVCRCAKANSCQDLEVRW